MKTEKKDKENGRKKTENWEESKLKTKFNGENTKTEAIYADVTSSYLILKDTVKKGGIKSGERKYKSRLKKGQKKITGRKGMKQMDQDAHHREN